MPQPDPVQIAKAKAKTWGIDIQPPRGDPRALILYLARHIYRVAIDERRLESIDPRNSTVSFHFRNRRENNRDELLTLDGSEFLRRFTLHVLPKGLVKIRYYGIFAHASKREALAASLAALRRQNQIRLATLVCLETLLASIAVPDLPQRCPRCKEGDLLHVGRVEPVLDPHPFHPP